MLAEFSHKLNATTLLSNASVWLYVVYGMKQFRHYLLGLYLQTMLHCNGSQDRKWKASWQGGRWISKSTILPSAIRMVARTTMLMRCIKCLGLRKLTYCSHHLQSLHAGRPSAVQHYDPFLYQLHEELRMEQKQGTRQSMSIACDIAFNQTWKAPPFGQSRTTPLGMLHITSL